MAGVWTRSHVHPPVRLRAVPPHDPPFDDESAGMWSRGLGGQLALDLSAPLSRTARPAVGGAAPPTGPTPLSPEALANASPEAKQAARRFVGTCLEIWNGYRPAAQIRPMTSPPNAAAMVAQLVAGGERLTPLRRPARRPPVSVRLRLLRVCEPRPGVAEGAAVLGGAGRISAMAFRLERRQGRWLGTTVRVL